MWCFRCLPFASSSSQVGQGCTRDEEDRVPPPPSAAVGHAAPVPSAPQTQDELGPLATGLTQRLPSSIHPGSSLRAGSTSNRAAREPSRRTRALMPSGLHASLLEPEPSGASQASLLPASRVGSTTVAAQRLRRATTSLQAVGLDVDDAAGIPVLRLSPEGLRRIHAAASPVVVLRLTVAAPPPAAAAPPPAQMLPQHPLPTSAFYRGSPEPSTHASQQLADAAAAIEHTLSGSQSQPLGTSPPRGATLLAYSTNGGRRPSASSIGGAAYQRQALEPVLLNTAACAFLRVNSAAEYKVLLEAAARRDPTLATVMEDALRRLLRGEAGTLRYVSATGHSADEPHAACGSMELIPVALRADDGSPATPGLVVAYGLEISRAELSHRLQRDYILLSHIPSIVTVFDMRGEVVHQNRASIACMGAATREHRPDDYSDSLVSSDGEGAGTGSMDDDRGGGGGGHSAGLSRLRHARRQKEPGASPLRQLFRYSPETLELLLETVAHGEDWQGLVQVPPPGIALERDTLPGLLGVGATHSGGHAPTFAGAAPGFTSPAGVSAAIAAAFGPGPGEPGSPSGHHSTGGGSGAASTERTAQLHELISQMHASVDLAAAGAAASVANSGGFAGLGASGALADGGATGRVQRISLALATGSGCGGDDAGGVSQDAEKSGSGGMGGDAFTRELLALRVAVQRRNRPNSAAVAQASSSGAAFVAAAADAAATPVVPAGPTSVPCVQPAAPAGHTSVPCVQPAAPAPTAKAGQQAGQAFGGWVRPEPQLGEGALAPGSDGGVQGAGPDAVRRYRLLDAAAAAGAAAAASGTLGGGQSMARAEDNSSSAPLPAAREQPATGEDAKEDVFCGEFAMNSGSAAGATAGGGTGSAAQSRGTSSAAIPAAHYSQGADLSSSPASAAVGAAAAAAQQMRGIPAFRRLSLMQQHTADPTPLASSPLRPLSAFSQTTGAIAPGSASTARAAHSSGRSSRGNVRRLQTFTGTPMQSSRSRHGLLSEGEAASASASAAGPRGQYHGPDHSTTGSGAPRAALGRHHSSASGGTDAALSYASTAGTTTAAGAAAGAGGSPLHVGSGHSAKMHRASQMLQRMMQGVSLDPLGAVVAPTDFPPPRMPLPVPPTATPGARMQPGSASEREYGSTTSVYERGTEGGDGPGGVFGSRGSRGSSCRFPCPVVAVPETRRTPSLAQRQVGATAAGVTAPAVGGGEGLGAPRAAQAQQQQQQQQQAYGQPAPVRRWQWHDVMVKRYSDPVLGRDLLLVIQTDVTEKVEAERRVAQLLAAEQAILDKCFPRHVIEALTRAEAAAEAGDGAEQDPRSSAGSDACAAGAEADGVAGAGDSGPPAGGLLAKLRHLHVATAHEQVTVLFADIVGFTTMCQQLKPQAVMTFLNRLYTRVDRLLDKCDVYKVETIGDCYMVAGGLVVRDDDGFTSVRTQGIDPDHARKTLNFARDMLAAARQVRNPVTGQPVQLRVGLHSGPVVSGVVGSRMPRFCLFGDTINTASRMEANSKPGRVHVSAATHNLLSDYAAWEPTGGLEVKGKGLMHTFLLAEPGPSAPKKQQGEALGDSACSLPAVEGRDRLQ